MSAYGRCPAEALNKEDTWEDAKGHCEEEYGIVGDDAGTEIPDPRLHGCGGNAIVGDLPVILCVLDDNDDLAASFFYALDQILRAVLLLVQGCDFNFLVFVGMGISF